MAFRFFRPWEDDWRPTSRETPASNHGAFAKDSTTNKPSLKQSESSDKTAENWTLSGKERRMTEGESEIHSTFYGVRETPEATMNKSQKPTSSLDKTLSSEGPTSVQDWVVPPPEMLDHTHADDAGVLGTWKNDPVGLIASADEFMFPSDISPASRTSSSPGYNSNETNGLVNISVSMTPEGSDTLSTLQHERPCSFSLSLLQSKASERGSKSSRGERLEQTMPTSDNVPRQVQCHTAAKPFTCKICEKAFPNLNNLLIHERTHTGSKPFKCAFCGKVFTQSSYLHRHQKTHTGSRPFKCKSCEKAFIRLSHLHVHEHIHTESKPFKCAFCERAFTQQNNLHVHERIHTGSKPFKCTVCNKAFRTSSHLCNHERIHTGSKPFKCTVCDRVFRSSSNFRYHERTHTGSKPFKCSFCEKAFTHSSTLHVHERSHTGSKPFKCTDCGKAFPSSSNLHKHERIHIGSKPFKCKSCGKAFARNDNLRQHERNHN